MTIDGGTATISLITVAFLTLPFVLDYRRRSVRGFQLLRTLREMAQQQQCELHKHEVHRDIALGLDVNRKVMFFLSQPQGVTELQHVHLTHVRACQVIRTGRGGKAAQPDAPIERVELCFLPKDNSGSEVRFVLFRETFGSLMEGEVQLAEKWAALVNGMLKN